MDNKEQDTNIWLFGWTLGRIKIKVINNETQKKIQMTYIISIVYISFIPFFLFIYPIVYRAKSVFCVGVDKSFRVSHRSVELYCYNYNDIVYCLPSIVHCRNK